MTRQIIYAFFALLLFYACRKDDNALVPDLERVPQPNLTKDVSADATISRDNPAAFKGKFVVDNYFKNDVPPQKMDIVVIKNGKKESRKTIQENVTSFPATIEITGAQLATLFGAPLVLQDKFEIGADITTQSGKKYEVFPLVGAPYGSGIESQPDVSLTVTYEVVCPFSINDMVGAATVEDPDFWGASYPVTISLQGADTYKVAGWVEEPGISILVKVNPVTLVATVNRQVYGPVLPTTTYTNPAVQGNGTVDACGKKINLRLTNTVDQGSFGTANVVIRK